MSNRQQHRLYIASAAVAGIMASFALQKIMSIVSPSPPERTSATKDREEQRRSRAVDVDFEETIQKLRRDLKHREEVISQQQIDIDYLREERRNYEDQITLELEKRKREEEEIEEQFKRSLDDKDLKIKELENQVRSLRADVISLEERSSESETSELRRVVEQLRQQNREMEEKNSALEMTKSFVDIHYDGDKPEEKSEEKSIDRSAEDEAYASLSSSTNTILHTDLTNRDSLYFDKHEEKEEKEHEQPSSEENKQPQQQPQQQQPQQQQPQQQQPQQQQPQQQQPQQQQQQQHQPATENNTKEWPQLGAQPMKKKKGGKHKK